MAMRHLELGVLGLTSALLCGVAISSQSRPGDLVVRGPHSSYRSVCRGAQKVDEAQQFPDMSLRLQPNPDSAHPEADQLAMSGNLCVGRVYKRLFTKTTQWLWAINGVQQTPPNVMRLAGVTGSFEEAEAELKENWAKWLTWAKLQEIND